MCGVISILDRAEEVARREGREPNGAATEALHVEGALLCRRRASSPAWQPPRLLLLLPYTKHL